MAQVRRVFYWTMEMATAEYLIDELARYDIEPNERVIRRLLTIGYSAQEIASGINPKFIWNEVHGRLDVREQ